MRVREFQQHIGALYLEKDKRRSVHGTFLWLMEEVGELAEAVRRGEREKLAEEMADVAAWLASVANLLEVDLEDAVRAKYPEKCARCGAKPCACPEAPVAPL